MERKAASNALAPDYPSHHVIGPKRGHIPSHCGITFGQLKVKVIVNLVGATFLVKRHRAETEGGEVKSKNGGNNTGKSS